MKNPKGIDWSTLKRLIRSEFGAHKQRYFIALIFTAIASATSAASAWITQNVINDIFVAKNGAMIAPIALGIMLIYVIRGVSTYVYTMRLSEIGADISAKLRIEAVNSVIARDVGFFDRFDRSEIINRITNATKSAADLFNTMTTAAARDLLQVIFLVAVMFYQDWLLAILSFLIGPPLVWGVSRLSKRIRGSVAKEFSANSSLLQLLTERLSGIRLVKSYNLEDTVRRDAGATIDTLRKRSIKIAKAKALSSPLTETFGGIAVALIIVYGGYSIVHLGSDPGSFFSFIVAFLMAYEPVKRLANLRVQLVKNTLPVQLLYDLLDAPAGPADGTKDLVIDKGRVDFKDVRFGYRDDVPALNGITFTAEAGKMTALVGQSGSGKSTLFSLLSRFYEPSSGAIEIDGQVISDIKRASLRDHIALISQDTVIFSGTIADNIRLGRADADLDAVIAAADAANVTEFVRELPEGFDTWIGEGGAALSGGQRQRVAIARAILKDAPILLMDEATSALDSESEARVQEALERAAKGKTVLVIAHRLSTIRNADRVVVLDHGQVVETGGHNELLAQGGAFKALYDMQFRD